MVQLNTDRGVTIGSGRGLERSVYTQHISFFHFEGTDMAKSSRVRFGSPWPSETRKYHEAIGEWFRTGSGPVVPDRPPDPLRPYRDARREQPKQPISMRVDTWVLELTKQMARQHRMPYQQIFRIWIQEGLRRALREGAQQSP